MAHIQTLADFLGVDLPLGSVEGTEYLELSVKDFCRGVLQSPEYRRSIYLRVIAGELPPAVECRMYDYAYGKPPDRVEHTGPDGDPIEVITRIVRVVVDPNEDEDTLPVVMH